MAFNLFDTLSNDLNIDLVANTVSVAPQLKPAEYIKVRNILSSLGGKWSTKGQVFEFNKCANTMIFRALEAGGRSINKYHLYPTPKCIADFIIQYTSLNFIGHSLDRIVKVLEPSIGEGALADELLAYGKENGIQYDVHGFEIDPLNAIFAEEKGYSVTTGDFLKQTPNPIYEVVLMNPPFDGDAYIKHIQHAQKFLAPNGRLISVVPTKFITEMKKSKLQEWLLEQVIVENGSDFSCGDFFDENTFKSAKVETTIIEIGSLEAYEKLITEKTYADRAAEEFTFAIQSCSTTNQAFKKLDEYSGDNIEQEIESFIALAIRERLKIGVSICPSHAEHLKEFINNLLSSVQSVQAAEVKSGENYEMFAAA